LHEEQIAVARGAQRAHAAYKSAPKSPCVIEKLAGQLARHENLRSADTAIWQYREHLALMPCGAQIGQIVKDARAAARRQHAILSHKENLHIAIAAFRWSLTTDGTLRLGNGCTALRGKSLQCIDDPFLLFRAQMRCQRQGEDALPLALDYRQRFTAVIGVDGQ
jgi:hypothetical protein